MDRIQQPYYEKEFWLRWRDARHDAFQRLFDQVMGKRYPKNFMACKPWGWQGSEKNDGYLLARRLFQVNGPEEMTSACMDKQIEDALGGVKFSRGNSNSEPIPEL